jgi:hypothetical protein
MLVELQAQNIWNVITLARYVYMVEIAMVWWVSR